MRIRKILSQSRRDFTAVYECQHCDSAVTASGYDDSYFHEAVIPRMKCEGCGKDSYDLGPTSTPAVPAHVVL